MKKCPEKLQKELLRGTFYVETEESAWEIHGKPLEKLSMKFSKKWMKEFPTEFQWNCRKILKEITEQISTEIVAGILKAIAEGNPRNTPDDFSK